MALKSNKNTNISPVWKKALQGARTYIYRSPLYQMTLKRRLIGSFKDIPVFVVKGVQLLGREIMDGRFLFAGRFYQAGDTPWKFAPEDTAWQMRVHGFGWLDDILGLDDPQADIKARQILSDWIETHAQWSGFIWRADIMGTRLVSWLKHAPKLINCEDEIFISRFKTSLSLQVSHLSRSYFKDLSGIELLTALRAQLYIALYLEGYEKSYQKVMDRLVLELNSQILPDGGHVSRCPTVLVDVLSLCLEVVHILRAQKVEIPTDLRSCIDRLAPMVRTLRHGDGALALFHGGQEGTASQIDELLKHSDNQGQTLGDARHFGFQRLEAGQTVLLMDVAPPPDVDCHSAGHAAPLSLEMSYGTERLLVNCGAVIGGNPSWQDALAATAAHNTLTVDEKNCILLLAGGGLVPSPLSVTYQRFEENGQTLIDASHDGYKPPFGLLHKRSVYLDKTGDDLRVEDHLIGAGGASYAISLHLHPDVEAVLVQEGKAALLKLPSGVGWHLKIKGASLKIKESIYAGRAGQLQKSDQILLQGPLRGEGVSVKWRLSRIGSV